MGHRLEPSIVGPTCSVDGSFGAGRVAVYSCACAALCDLCAASSDPLLYHLRFVLAGERWRGFGADEDSFFRAAICGLDNFGIDR